MKDGGFNVSAAAQLVDSVKQNAGYDVTMFYNDTRVLATIVEAMTDNMKSVNEVAAILKEKAKVFEV